VRSSSPRPVVSPVSNAPSSSILENVLERGRGRARVFVRDIDAVDVHMLISSFCFFRINNRLYVRREFWTEILSSRNDARCIAR
jgi:hypothetical protein